MPTDDTRPDPRVPCSVCDGDGWMFASVLAKRLAALAASGAVTEGLDVERLRRAANNVNDMDPAAWLDHGDYIDVLAAEYARLSGVTDRPDRLREALRALWDCGVASGMDTDGDDGPEATIAGMGVEAFARAMVREVETLRAAYDERLSESTTP